ncbi:sulfate permease family protein [Nocardioidaceae bacterium Broad-1]|uniref:SulP family inorganic anion transporter n=1 Tax=Nocardioides luteus TaxID=1844 RepID=UPI00020288DA|nr:SulP family inorganic anion transporter [Nocardioides luteus]EGD42220.1 sulfate permease family protein [Nocardioidaceae bacterium Broad-1]MBG6094556.1 SulP family sulfate permease [Nocardioides luteus]
MVDVSSVSLAGLRDRGVALLPGREDWQAVRRDPRRDLVAGVTVAVVALPLALAFGVSSGMGASAGIVTAVVAGIVAAVFGGSNLQVSGPTGAMTVVLVPIIHDFGRDGVLMVGLLAGIMLLIAAGLGLGKLVRYLPIPVIEGFTVGIAVVIGLQQVPAMFGIDGGEFEHTWQVALDVVRRWLGQPQWAPVVMAVLVAAFILAAQRWRPAVPWSLVAIVLATVAGLWSPVEGIGELPPGLPAPSAGFVSLSGLTALVPAAAAVAALSALESLLCATVADSMTVDESHDPDRELIGQGLANLAVPFFGGVPATAAIARTAVNVRAGARSKLAAVTHAVVLLVIVSALAGLVSHIPLAALAGVLLATCVRMIEVASVLALLRSTRGDAVVLVLTFVVTVVFDLVDAVIAGLLVSILYALRQVARSAVIERVEPFGPARGMHSEEEHELLKKHIVVYRFDGPLFFAAAHRFLLELSEVADVRVVVLRMSRVTTIDATGAKVLDEVISRLERRGKVVMISGISPEHAEILARLGVADHLRRDDRIHSTTPEAISRALELVAEHAAT